VDVPDSFKYDFDAPLNINNLIRPKEGCVQIFRFLASQEVLRLLQVFIVSLKEAKRTFLTRARMTWMVFFTTYHLIRP